MKQWWVIKNQNNKCICDALGKIRFFETPFECMTVIETEYANSPYLKPFKWKKKKTSQDEKGV